MNEKYDKINNQVERLGELFFDFVQNQLSKNIAKNEEINYLTRPINKIDDAMLKNRFEFIDLSSDVLKLKRGNK